VRKEKRLINVRKAENDDINTLKVSSIKNAKLLLECPTRSLRLLLLSTQKLSSMTRKCWNRAWLAGTRLLIFAGKQTENVAVKHLSKHTAYVFISFTSVFAYLCSKKQTHCTYVWRHKDVKAQREDHVATRLPWL